MGRHSSDIASVSEGVYHILVDLIAFPFFSGSDVNGYFSGKYTFTIEHIAFQDTQRIHVDLIDYRRRHLSHGT
jgi:hypothetical protein